MAGLFGDNTTTTKTETILNPQQKKLTDMALGHAGTYSGQPIRWPTAAGKPAVPGLDPAQKAKFARLMKIAAPGGASLTAPQAGKLKQLEALKAKARPAKPGKAISTVVPFTGPQITGQKEALDAAGAQQKIADEAAGAESFLTNPNILNPATNPAEQAAINAATTPIYQQLAETTLPALRSGAAAAGQYGGSRQGIAEGLASQSASQAAGMTGAAISNADYQAGLDAMTRGLGLAPSTGGLQTQPAATTSGVGEIQQQQQEAQNQAALQRAFYNMGIPLSKAQNLMGMASGTPGGGTSASATGTTNPITGALGGAGLGAAIGSGFPGVGTGVGAAAGGGIGALLAMLGV